MSDQRPPSRPPGNRLRYADAGVDIDAGEALVARIAPTVARTRRAGVIGGLGGFGGLFELPPGRYREPVLVSGTDGVGTKLRLALALDAHDTIGIDLVAMCVNDIAVSGAEPLWFLDYFACGRLDVERAARVIEGIARGCEIAGAALLGGETAEMPGMYTGEDYDLAGFAVGVVEKGDIVDGRRVGAGDAIIGLASSGPHANGYSLIRRRLEGEDLGQALGDTTLGQALIAPTRIYVAALRALLDAPDVDLRAIAHVTGGGLTENLPRALPAGLVARLAPARWPRPAVFDWIAGGGLVDEGEMLRTFNCGIGLALVVPEADVDAALARLGETGEDAWRIGRLAQADDADAPARVAYVAD